MVYCVALHGTNFEENGRVLVDPEKDKELKGILGYIKMTHTNRDENGITLKRMEFEQKASAGSGRTRAKIRESIRNGIIRAGGTRTRK